MKTFRKKFFLLWLLALGALLAAPCSSAQTGAVTKSTASATLNDLTADLHVPSGKSLTLKSGGTLDAAAGTLTLAANQIAWAKVDKTGSSLADLSTRLFADLQSKPTTAVGYGVTNGAAIDALSAVATSGGLHRTAANTYAARTLTGTAGQITVSNGDGVSGNPTLSLPATTTVTTAFNAGADVASTSFARYGSNFMGLRWGNDGAGVYRAALTQDGNSSFGWAAGAGTGALRLGTSFGAYAGLVAHAGGSLGFYAGNANHATLSASTFSVLPSTPSTSTTTGALTVAGGAGFGGAGWFGLGLNAQTLSVNGSNSAASYPLTVQNLALKASNGQYVGLLLKTADASPVDLSLVYFANATASDRAWRLGAFDNGGGGWSKGQIPGALEISGNLTLVGQLVVGHATEIQVRDTSGAANTRGISGLSYARLADSTAASPAFAFNSDPDNGMYLIGVNSIGFSTAGVRAVGIDANQNTTFSGDVRPLTHNTFDLGSTSARWRGLWVQGTAEVGAVNSSSSILSTHGTNGLGYGTGAGGTVTQATSRTTGVTLNKVTGAITLVSAAGSAAWQSFTVTNSAVAATDTIIVNQVSGTDLYMMHVTAVAAGSFRITFATTGGTTTEQPVFRFTIIKSVSS